MKKLFTYFTLAACLVVNPALAKVALAERAAGQMQAAMPAGCMTENASININVTGNEPDVNAISGKFDEKKTEIEKQFTVAKLTKFELQSMNYNINPAYNGVQGFQYNGSYSYVVQPASKAALVMAELTKKGYQASVNVSSYRNGGVPCPAQQ